MNKKIVGRLNIQPTKNDVYREVSTVDTFYRIKAVSSADGKKCVKYTDPIYLLFDEQRLKAMGADSAIKYIDSIMSNMKSNPLSELRKNCSDEDLLMTVKSRHLQSPSEILSWTRYMSQNIEYFKREVSAAKLAAEKAKEAKQKVEQTTQTETK